MMPESFEYAKNGGRKYLFHNLGGGKFEEVSAKLGIDSRRWALAAAAGDLRGTGQQDLFIANDYGVSELYFNNGKQFREVGQETGVGFAPKSGMTAAFGDILNQGKYAVYVSNISEDGVLIQGNNLWVPKEGTSGEAVRYENLARELGVEMGGWSWGMQFGDLNNDGTLDLYLTNGYVSADRNKSYWYDFSKVAGGNSTIIGDAANWPAMEGRSLSGYQQKRVWLNDGAGKFVDVAQPVGATDTYDGRSVALADLWNRGVLDVIVTNQRGPLLIYKNTVTPENKWIDFELEGTASNRSALGAEVKLFWNGRQQVQTVSGGSGFCAENQRRLHFGLGRNAQLEKAVIRWPSGKTQMIDNPVIGQIILESYKKTVLAIVAAIITELILGRIFFGKWLNLASAYITGISVGILIRSPAYWPYALCSVISIMSKYVLRVKGRHIWNPSNFGIAALLLLAPETLAVLSIQWGNNLLPIVVIWILGSIIIWRARRFHISATYVVSFFLFAFLRSWITGDPWQAEVAPITGPMYQLFVFFMITDPKTTVRSRTGQCVVAFCVALVEFVLRLDQVVYAPIYALFIVGPTANLIEIWLDSRHQQKAAATGV